MDSVTSATLVKKIPIDLKDREIYAFDMDDTLIKTKSGHKFPKDQNDWEWLFPIIPNNLKELHAKGIIIAIISNQKGVSTGSTKLEHITEKIQAMSDQLGFSLTYFVATSDDKYRKPSPMIGRHIQELGGKLTIYVGDAAGRPASWKIGKKKDFSCSDRKFAFNCGIKFATPEEFFLNESEAQFEYDGCDQITFGQPFQYVPTAPIEMIVMVGMPASGKSTLAKEISSKFGHEYINQDTLKTKIRCIKAAKVALSKGKSIIIDNTCPSVEARKEFTSLVKNAPTVCIWMKTSEELSRHNNEFRTICGGSHIPCIVYAKYKKSFVEPTIAEGFSVVHAVDFCPVFSDKSLENLYASRL